LISQRFKNNSSIKQKKETISIPRQIQEIQSLSQILNSSLQTFIQLTTTKSSQPTEAVQKLIKGSRYLGTSLASGIIEEKHKWTEWHSTELEITDFDVKTSKVQAQLTRTELRKDIDGKSSDPNLPEYLQEYLSELGECKTICTGEFDVTRQTLTLIDKSSTITKESKTEWPLNNYHLILHDKALIGVAFEQQEIQHSISKSSLVLKQF